MNIKCPNCGQLIALEQNVYDSIANDVRNEQFEKELEKRAVSLSKEKDAAVQLAVSKAQNEKEKEIAALEAKLSKIAAEFEAEKQKSKSEFSGCAGGKKSADYQDFHGTWSGKGKVAVGDENSSCLKGTGNRAFE